MLSEPIRLQYKGHYFNSSEDDEISSLTVKQDEVVRMFVKGMTSLSHSQHYLGHCLLNKSFSNRAESIVMQKFGI